MYLIVNLNKFQMVKLLVLNLLLINKIRLDMVQIFKIMCSLCSLGF